MTKSSLQKKPPGPLPKAGKLRSRPRFTLRVLRNTLIGACLVGAAGVAGFGPLFLQDDPILEASSFPTPQDVAATRQLVRDLRAAAGGEAQSNLLVTNVTQLNSAIRLGARIVDGFRGRVTIDGAEVLGEISVPVQWWSGQKWLNISGRVPEFDGQVSARQITAGRVKLPGSVALTIGRIGANLGLGDQFGDKVLNAVTAMKATGQDLTFRIVLDDVGKNGVMRSAFGSLRGAQMPAPEEIEEYHQLIRTAMETGQLSNTGSFLPYLQFALAAALQRSTPETFGNAYTAAAFGLAKACGARDFALVVGSLAFDVADTVQDWAQNCDAVTLNGRIDSKRHFITSAALQAASNTGVAVSLGEFKELYDSISGAGGFDFTDMAANLSGIRMSNTFMNTPSKDWPDLLARLERETDVIVSFEGIPPIMTEETFKDAYSDVGSAAYAAELANIEAKIDRLAVHRSP